ncbi:MAG: ion channel [Cyclobacteriaceae bacterium]
MGKRSNITEKLRDIGLGSKRTSTEKLIDDSGNFNVVKKGGGIDAFSFYHWLINISWAKFFLFITSAYILINLLFGSLYFVIGADKLTEFQGGNLQEKLLHCFFFSTQTLTTVGFGRISPLGIAANMTAALEAMVGLMGFAFATGILYGRFSKARAKIIFSKNILVSPYKGIKGLKFRISNLRKNQLIDMEASVIYSFLEKTNGEIKRRYSPLNLEISFINMFPLPWTIVHPIDEESPIYQKGVLDFSKENAEFIIILKGYDDTFNQYVHQVYDYKHSEIVFDADFSPMFDPTGGGGTVVELDKISDYRKV